MVDRKLGGMDHVITRRGWTGGLIGLGAGLAAFGAVGELFAAAAATGSEQPIRIQDFSQAAFVVGDIEAAVKRVAELFGVAVPRINTTDPADKAHTVYRGAATQAQAKLAFFQLGQVTLELIEPIGGPSTWREALQKNGEGFHHLAFQVADMDRAISHLRQKGCEVIQTGDFTGGCYAYVDARPAVGCVIELLASKRS
jgi:hypothetical protein